MTRHAAEQPPDDELLARFVAGRDQRAFAALVSRHGPMVNGTAWRILRSEHDAEDACQATFLALAAAAERLRRRTALVAWLHQTAMRTAKSMARSNARWHRNVRGKAELTDESYVPPRYVELQEVLDEALRRLSPRHRAAVLLCDLEGLSRKEAAERLDLPLSTVCSLVARGRRSLAKRLARMGVTLTAAGLTATLTTATRTGASELSTETIQTTTRNALRFAAGRPAAEIGVSTAITTAAQGVLTAMTVTKFSMVAAAALAIVFGFGAIGGVGNGLLSVARAVPILIDNFDDGNADGWTEYDLWPTPGTFNASSGAYRFDGMQRSPGTGSNMTAIYDPLQNSQFSNGVLRARVRANTIDTFLGLAMRISGSGPDQLDGYLYGVPVGGIPAIYKIVDSGGPGTEIISQLPSTIPLAADEDWVFEAGAVGEVLTFKYWRLGDPEPSSPQLEVNDSTFQFGSFGVETNVNGALTRPGQLSATFDDITFTSIPEPPTAMLSAIFFAGVFAWQWRRSHY